jgi:CubicO group peptidase (beta-lactamase class C family)
MGLRQALQYGRETRVSRWPPDTRKAYCNTGPAVAAYIVERIVGQRFEEYVQQNFFIPIRMKTATYFKPSPLSTAILYNDDGKSPYPYWNILYRPSGAVNASAEHMAAYVRFYLDRGKVEGRQVMAAADIDRMESPTNTWAAKAGLKNGYDLSNYWSVGEAVLLPELKL